jgi:arylsulfatase A-like enzyme
MRALAVRASLLLILVLLLVPLVPGVACGPAKPPPSVILVSIDTLRADHVGTYGYARPTTPFLDGFARDATVFENTFTSCPWTLVAHMTMLTGLFPAQHGVVQAELGLSPEVPLLAERMKAAGYQTWALLSLLDHKRFGFDRGARLP